MNPRAFAGLGVAVAAVLLAAPPAIVGWSAAVHAAPSRWAAGLAPGGVPRHVADPLVPFALPMAVCALLLVAGCLLPKPALPWREAVPRRPGMMAMGLGLLLLLEPVLHLALLALIGWHAPPGSGDLMLPRASGNGRIAPAIQMAVLTLAVPIAEEFFFRGRLVPWLREHLGSPSALSLSALAFACAHADPCQALVALPLGVLLGWLRLSGGGLGTCIIVHQAHNALFVATGPTVVAAPWVGLVLAMGAVACLALAWTWPRRGTGLDPRRTIVACLAAIAVILAIYPGYQLAQNRVWLVAMHRAIAFGHLQDDILLQRVDLQCLRGKIDMSRRKALVLQLVAKPSPSRDRQVWIVARLDPDALAPRTVEEAHDDLARLASCPLHLPTHDLAARAKARAWADSIGRLVTEVMDGEIMQRWFPLPAAADEALEQIAVSSGAERHRFLAGMERAFPGRIADLLFKLRPDEVTPADRHFLFDRYADARERLEALALRDPERAQAFLSP